MKIAVLLAGSGVYDGSEIHESVFTLLAIDENNAEACCIAPNRKQFHVLNHLNGEELQEERNILVESARIARGAVQDLATVSVNDFNALVIPGGFGAAKNLNQWAINGPQGEIDAEVKSFIIQMIKAGKPVAGLCMGPTVIAKALEGENIKATLTIGSTTEASPYDIKGISDGMASLGAVIQETSIREIAVDADNKIITAPCYMLEASLVEIRQNVKQAIDALIAML